jgi:hypothetical protein
MRIISAFAVAAFALTGFAQAQVRVEPQPSAFINAANAHGAAMLFGRSGAFMIAGGVVLGGTATFALEHDGTDLAVAAGLIHPLANADGSVSLTYAGQSYAVQMPAGLACPLGQFVARDGMIAYTIPKFMDADSRRAMMRAGLKHHRVAQEFDGTPFEPLLHAADFAETAPLPRGISQALTSGMNTANGLDGFVIQAADGTSVPIGSLINTDAQITYRVYLMQGRHQTEIGGVPLRYFWQLDRSGAAGVFAVEAFAQNWPAGTGLSDLSAPGAKASQYDIVNFFQVAGLFHQLQLTNPAQFHVFVETACGRRT